jgi:hypothetical protein
VAPGVESRHFRIILACVEVCAPVRARTRACTCVQVRARERARVHACARVHVRVRACARLRARATPKNTSGYRMGQGGTGKGRKAPLREPNSISVPHDRCRCLGSPPATIKKQMFGA